MRAGNRLPQTTRRKFNENVTILTWAFDVSLLRRGIVVLGDRRRHLFYSRLKLSANASSGELKQFLEAGFARKQNLVSERSKPASRERMKTSHFEERFALRVVPTAQEREERTQRELATLDIDLGGEWLRPTGGLRGTGHSPGDGGAAFAIGRFKKPAKVLTGSPEPEPTAKPAIPLSGSEPVLAESKPAIPLTGWFDCRSAKFVCAMAGGRIESAVQVSETGLSAQRIYQDLICNHAFTGGYHSVQRFVRQLLQTQPVPFVRMEVEPGQEAQVDFGQGAWVLVNGKRKRPHLFRFVLFPFPQRLQ